VSDERQTRRDLERGLARVRLEWNNAAETLATAERRHALAREALHLSQRAFELGETDLVQLLRAREQALDAESQLKLRRLERGRIAARLNQALGMIPR
jgi:outer membrane protein TolC